MPTLSTVSRGCLTGFIPLAILAALAGTPDPARAASVDCQADRNGTELVLYLYFPAAEDDDFPSPMFEQVTAPLAAFSASDLDGDVGSTAQFRNAISERVRTDFCEFDMRVVPVTSDPDPDDDRFHVVGIGSDAQTGGFYGVCCNSNSSRVWAGEFLQASQPGGDIDGALTGGNSTLARWANAISGTSSHEPGHTSGLGLAHEDSAARPSEDVQQNHLMATGTVGGLGGEDRTSDRHFSDTSFEIMSGTVGLYEQTLSNWDFINPNNATADGLRITVLVSQGGDDPEIGSVYDGGLSPWGDATIAANGTVGFDGDTYDRFVITFTDPQDWNNGDAGEIPAGEEFHVGVGLTRNYIVRDVTLLDDGDPMDLHPRVVGYTPDGSFDPATGDYHLTLSVPDPENGPLIVSDVSIRHLPRTVAINEMVATGALIGIDGRSIVPWDSRAGDPVEVTTTADLAVANLAERRAVHLDAEPDPECGTLPEPVPIPDHQFLDLPYCREGPVLGLFPSARVYVEATVTDPDARFFDRDTGTMVTGPLSSRIFIQFPGAKPDLNDNGVDDAIDIDTGVCDDDNGNGVCDSAEPTRYRYAAKLVCGDQPKAPSDGRLVKGHYATTINILNVSDEVARIRKSLLLSFPPEEQRQGEVLPIAIDSLRPGHALKTDCADIAGRLFPQGWPTPYVEGYVAIESFTPLDVTGVYTSRDVEAAPPCRDGGPGHGGHGGHGCGKGCDGGHGRCPSAPALSTTLEVVPIREHVIERKEPPVPMCPDLTVTDIGGPQVDCPRGSGSCVTRTSYTLANIGNAASGPFQSRATLDPRQSVTVDEAIAELLPGQSRNVQVTTPRGGNCFDPDCTISVVADVSNRVEECREDNNSAEATTPG